MSGSEIVVLGRLADPYGIRGWLRLHPFGDDPLAWADMPVWWIGREGGPWREVGLKGLKAHGDGIVVLLDEVPDRTAAEALKGTLVGAPRDMLPPPADDEFYWGDLLGLVVVNEADETLGTVAGLIETGANDVLRVVAGDGTERLLPFVEAVVLAVEKEAGRIRVAWGSDW
ncbi:ribosome maturation factor RimM [uncultured Azonexus sp.]|uniref:ribosome maturation factor RimM n=1 Tax=uncultured Azonexus sp. TaxID=520307 RepID=UPI002605BD95|nr:ribosome maturation factor RimM [uncultured Azonexus sp.]